MELGHKKPPKFPRETKEENHKRKVVSRTFSLEISVFKIYLRRYIVRFLVTYLVLRQDVKHQWSSKMLFANVKLMIYLPK